MGVFEVCPIGDIGWTVVSGPVVDVVGFGVARVWRTAYWLISRIREPSDLHRERQFIGMQRSAVIANHTHSRNDRRLIQNRNIRDRLTERRDSGR